VLTLPGASGKTTQRGGVEVPEVTRCVKPAETSRDVEAVMTRVVVAVAAVSMLMTTAAGANPTQPDITVVRNGEERTVTLRAGALRITQTLGARSLNVQLTEGDDEVAFTADLDGRVTIRRGDAQRSFSVRAATEQDQAGLNAMLLGSRALAAFDDLMQSAWAHDAQVATVFRTAREVLRVLQTDHRSIEWMAAARPISSPMVLRVRQRLTPAQCWDTYARDVVHFTYELQSCLASVGAQWWNPLATAWCGYEYNLKSSLAAVWLLDCYGVRV
jgi:hypothetical protein